MGGGGVTTRETREGWPLLTVEIEVNGGSKSKKEWGLSVVGSLGLSFRFKRLLSCLGCSGQPSKKYFFPHSTPFPFMCPHRPATWAGSRAGPPVSEYESPVTNPAPNCQPTSQLFPIKIFDDDFVFVSSS
jgi:hypothetical protein